MHEDRGGSRHRQDPRRQHGRRGSRRRIQSAVLAIQFGLTTDDVANTWAPYLTFAEAFKLAAQTQAELLRRMKTKTTVQPPIDNEARVRAAAFRLLLARSEPIGQEALARETGIGLDRVIELLDQLERSSRPLD